MDTARVLLIALVFGTFLCGPALAMLPEPAAPTPTRAATECSALASAYERGYWAGWRQRSTLAGGGL